MKDLINYLDKLNLKIAIVDEIEKVLEIFDKNDLKNKMPNNLDIFFYSYNSLITSSLNK